MSDDDRLASEYVLGVLDGEELLTARGRAARDPAFAALVTKWEDRFAPLLDGPEVEPRAELLHRVNESIDRPAGSDGATVAQLRRSARIWKIATFAASAVAAVALAVLAVRPDMLTPPPEAQSAEAPLVASVPIAETDLRLAVTWLPDREELLVSASGLTADGIHDHELWVAGSGDAGLQSLGVVEPGAERRVAVSPEAAQLVTDGAQLVLTREPIGGAQPGAAAGPVVASGILRRI